VSKSNKNYGAEIIRQKHRRSQGVQGVHIPPGRGLEYPTILFSLWAWDPAVMGIMHKMH